MRTPIILIAFALLISACVPTFERDHITSAAPAVQAFKEISTPFTHSWVEPSHPFTGAAIIDVDDDGRFEVFVGGGRGQEDMLLGFDGGALVDVMGNRQLSKKGPATHGAASSDLDNDGDTDLVVAREDGLTIYLNNGGQFEAREVPLALAKDAVPLSVSVSDVNGDGHGDLYVSAFVSFSAFKSATFNDAGHAKKNVLLVNNGDMTFRDATQSSGTGSKQNTFHTTFVDLDNDGDQDMVLAQNTGEVEIFERTADAIFKSVVTNTGYGFWMGIGIGDYDQDGDQDIFVSNIGSSIPDFLTSGDIRDDQKHETRWILMRNDGGMTFSNVTESQNLNGYGFAWGAQFEDINLDGEIDLLVAQNYIKWPLHKWGPLPGKALLQVDAPEGKAFYQVPGLGLENANFAQSPVIVDLDGDGRADVLWLNMAGPLRAFLNRSEGNYITVKVPDRVDTLGATVSVTLKDGKTLRRQIVASTGLMTDPTPDLHFGLGQASDVEKVEIVTMSGARAEVISPKINGTISLNP